MLEKRVAAYNLKHNMYVSRLDRPWVETPFVFQGFYLKQKQLDYIQQHCEYVFIDIERGEGAEQYLEDISPKEVINTEDKFEKELPIAKEKYFKLTTEFSRVMENIKLGKALEINVLETQVNSVIEGIMTNSDAYLLLSRLKNKDNYTYTHSVSCSILAISLGKELGFSKQELEGLAIGSLLFDIGKMKLSDDIITSREKFEKDRHKVVESHVQESVMLLKETPGVKDLTIQIAQNHHERFDGSGYPRGLKGKEIPLSASIAGMVDCYDAMTSERTYSKPIKHDEAVNELYSRKNIDFKEELIEHFIQCLGIYPSGTLVELNTGEVGIVVQQNRVRRLRPKIMLLLNKDKESNDYFPIINLLNEVEDKQGNPLGIKKSLEPNAYGIDPEKFYL